MKYSSSCTFSALAMICIFLVASCKTNSSQQSEDELYYYPEKNVYFDIKNAKYYYSLDSTASWDSLTFNGTDYGLTLGERIAVNMPPGNAWENNDADRKTYNGIILNVVNTRTILLAKQDSINRQRPRIIIKPKTNVDQEEVVNDKEEPPKRGLKKFFNKLFGKKKAE